MTEIQARSYISVAQENQSTGPKQTKEQTVLPQDSFKVVAKIANSTRLSDGEKSGLISHVALIDKYAQGSLRSRMLNSVSATTLFLERQGSVKSKPSQSSVAQAVAQVKQTTQVSPPAETKPAAKVRQAEELQKSVEQLPVRFAQTTQTEVNKAIPQAEVAAIQAQPIQQVAQNTDVKVQEVRPLPAQPLEVKDNVQISESARVAQDFDLPGAGGSEVEFKVPGSGGGDVEIAVPGSGESAEVPLPGAGGGEDIVIQTLGSGEYEEVALPGSGGGEVNIQAEVEARIAALEERGVPELPIPGGVNVEEIAQQIQALPGQAIDSIGELTLPGGGDSNGSVNERAAQVALSV